MRTKVPGIVFATILVGFFGYLAYQEFLFDDTAVAKSAVQFKIEQLNIQPEAPVKPPEYFGLKRAEVALQEYHKGVVEPTPGCNCGPDIDKYTESTPAQWCAMFVSWVTREAGAPMYDERTKSWRFMNSRLLIEYLKLNGTWYSREEVIANNLKPRLGDFVFFYRGELEENLGHVDVVVDVSGAAGTAGLIGGNIRDRVLYRENFPYQEHYGFLGFGRPEKE